MAAFRIASLLYVEYHGDLTFDILPAAIWAYAQIATAIMLACCPLLRPVFEKMIPKSLTRIGTPTVSAPTHSRWAQAPAIRVTTRIVVYDDSTSPPNIRGSLHDGNMEPYGPVFEVQTMR